MEQLALLNLPLRDRQIVAALIDALDDDGYLTSSLEEITDMFSENDALEPEELMIGLKYLQSFEPAGVGARDPAECLGLQLQGAARRYAVSRRGAEDRRRPPAAARRARLHQAPPRAALRRGVRARRARADPQPQPAAGRVVRQGRGELRDPGRGRTQGTQPVDRVAERSGDAEAAPQSHLRRHPDAQPRRRRTSSSRRSCRKRSG